MPSESPGDYPCCRAFCKNCACRCHPHDKTSVSSFRPSQARHRTPRKIYPQRFALVVILYVHYLGQFFIKIEYICRYIESAKSIFSPVFMRHFPSTKLRMKFFLGFFPFLLYLLHFFKSKSRCLKIILKHCNIIFSFRVPETVFKNLTIECGIKTVQVPKFGWRITRWVFQVLF